MKCHESGTMEPSEFFFHTPTTFAKSLLFYVEICGHFYSNSNYSINRENFGNFMLLYVLNGSLHVQTVNFDTIIAKGNIVFIDCYKWHSYKTPEYCEFVYVHFNGSNSRDFYNHIIQQRGYVFSTEENSSISHYFNLLLTNSRNEKRVPEITFSQILYSLLSDIAAAPQDITLLGNKSRLIENALSYIHLHLSEQISLNDISSHIGLSPYYFSRMFKQIIGMSPYEYIILSRIDNAKYLLRMTSKTVSEIAFEVGYTSENNFITAFTKRAGISPGKFRKLFPS